MRPIPTPDTPDDPADRSLIEWWRRRLGSNPGLSSFIERGGSRGLLVACGVLTLLGTLTCCWGVWVAVHR